MVSLTQEEPPVVIHMVDDYTPMDADYTASCGKVVSPDIYDQGECPKECTNTGPIM